MHEPLWRMLSLLCADIPALFLKQVESRCCAVKHARPAMQCIALPGTTVMTIWKAFRPACAWSCRDCVDFMVLDRPDFVIWLNVGAMIEHDVTRALV